MTSTCVLLRNTNGNINDTTKYAYYYGQRDRVILIFTSNLLVLRGQNAFKINEAYN